MNRTQLHNPKHADQATLERAVRLLVESIGKDADPVSAVRSVVSTICMNDTDAEMNMGLTLNKAHDLALDISEALWNMWDAYTDGMMELEDNPDSLSLCSPSAGAGSCDEGSAPLPASLETLPPKARDHLARRYIRCSDRRALERMAADGEGLLARAMRDELAARNAIASENAEAASNCMAVAQSIADNKPLPLARLGNRGYETEVN